MFFARPDDVSLPPVIYSMLLCVTSYSKLLVSLYGVWLRLIINQLGWSRKHCSAFVTPFNVCLFCLIILIKRKRPNRGLPVSEKPLMQFGWCNMRLQGIFHPNTSSDPLFQMGGKHTHTQCPGVRMGGFMSQIINHTRKKLVWKECVFLEQRHL